MSYVDSLHFIFRSVLIKKNLKMSIGVYLCHSWPQRIKSQSILSKDIYFCLSILTMRDTRGKYTCHIFFLGSYMLIFSDR